MREFVIRQWKGLAFEKAKKAVSETPSSCQFFPEAGNVMAEPASRDDLPKTGSAPSVEAPPAAEANASLTTSRSARRKGERNFVVAYDGRFVGVFEAEEELTPREAFLRVADGLSSRKDFDPGKLQLYKPVLLRSARPPRGGKFVSGTLTEIGGRIHAREDKETARTSPSMPNEHAARATPASPVEEHVCQEQA